MAEKYKGPKPAIPVSGSWPIDKFAEDGKGNWYVEGYCATFDTDLVGDVLDRSQGKEFAKQMVGLTLLYNHDPDRPIGKCVAASADDRGIYVKCLISKTETDLWEKIKEGILDKFSVRFYEEKAEPARKGGNVYNLIKKLKMTELSLTSLPCNPQAKAALAYTGKSIGMEGEMEKGKVNPLLLLQESVDGLVKDLQEGKLEEIVETLKQGGYGYGKLCPFYQSPTCPVGATEDKEAQTKAAERCEYSKIYSCPYLTTQEKEVQEATAEGTGVEEAKKTLDSQKTSEDETEFTNEEWLAYLDEELEILKSRQAEIYSETQQVLESVAALHKEMVKTLGDLGLRIKSLESSNEKISSSFEEFAKSTVDKFAILESMVEDIKTAAAMNEEQLKSFGKMPAQRQGLEEDSEDGYEAIRKRSVWKGVFPF